jgi:hypothetical protein
MDRNKLWNLVRDRSVGGSNPLTSTILFNPAIRGFVVIDAILYEQTA